MGYSGGAEDAPSYRSMGGHTEAVLVAFDPTEVTLETLLDIFWESHYPKQKTSYRQYRNVVFYNDEEQQTVIEASRDEVAKRIGGEVGTAVEAASAFFPAEDYHQKYMARRKRDLYSTLRAAYPEEADFVASTITARINGLLDGKGTLSGVEKELNRSSIPAMNREAILKSIR